MGPVSMIYFIPLVTPTYGDIRCTRRKNITLGSLYFAHTVTVVTIITDNVYFVSAIIGTNHVPIFYNMNLKHLQHFYIIILCTTMYSETWIEISSVIISVRY